MASVRKTETFSILQKKHTLGERTRERIVTASQIIFLEILKMLW